MKPYLIAVALVGLLAACSVAPSQPGQTPRTSTLAHPQPTVEVLGTKLTARPAPLPAPKVTASPKPTHKTVKPAQRHTVTTRRAPAGTCTVGSPCGLTGLKWTKTYGCTLAWRRATGMPCPPGWPPIP